MVRFAVNSVSFGLAAAAFGGGKQALADPDGIVSNAVAVVVAKQSRQKNVLYLSRPLYVLTNGNPFCPPPPPLLLLLLLLCYRGIMFVT